MWKDFLILIIFNFSFKIFCLKKLFDLSGFWWHILHIYWRWYFERRKGILNKLTWIVNLYTQFNIIQKIFFAIEKADSFLQNLRWRKLKNRKKTKTRNRINSAIVKHRMTRSRMPPYTKMREQKIDIYIYDSSKIMHGKIKCE